MWIVTYQRSVNEIMGFACQGVRKTYADAVELRNLFVNRHGEGETRIVEALAAKEPSEAFRED